MKKFLSILLSLALLISMLSLFGISASAEPTKIILPEVKYPTMSYKTFAETGIPYDEILANFPEKLEVKYENGILSIQSFCDDEARFMDYLNYEKHDCVLENGYWKFDISEDEYNEGGIFLVDDEEGTYNVEYNLEGNRRMVFVQDMENKGNYCLQLYPVDGYAEQYVQISYTLSSGLEICDLYSEGFLYEQEVRANYNNGDYVIVDYDIDGNVTNVCAILRETGGYVSYDKDIGWTDYSDKITPVETPEGFENFTYEDLIALSPTDIGCTHQWNDPLCDLPSVCALCQREKGSALGHTWVKGSEYSTCSDCNGILYHIPETNVNDFTKAPKLNLEETGFSFEELPLDNIKKIQTKFENGIFMVPNIEGCEIDLDSPNNYFWHQTENGWNFIKIDSEDLEDLEIDFYKMVGNDENYTSYSLSYNYDGNLKYIKIYKSETKTTVYVRPEKNVVELLYYENDEDEKIGYTDTYENGILSSRAVDDIEKNITVLYDSDLKVKRVLIRVDWTNYYFFPDKGWTSDSRGENSIEAPEGYEDKNAEYFAAEYPHGIDFCIHSYEDTLFGKECAKCGETVFEITAGLIILIVVILAVSVTVVVVIICKKKKINAK